LITIEGIVVAGHGVASGRSALTANNPYPEGTIAMQEPHFKARGLDLSHCHKGTINLDLAPTTWDLLQADHCFENLRWTHLHPPETFSFVSIQAIYQGASHDGWVYFPHPETKAAHFQSRSVMELLLPRLEGLQSGASLTLRMDPRKLRLNDPA
jgi:hypothetical protein